MLIAHWAGMASALCLVSAAAAVPPPCVWGSPSQPLCKSAAYAGDYPTCSLFQYANGQPIPCSGLVHGASCNHTMVATPPTPASWHVHIFFPNPNCTNCSASFSHEKPGFTFAGAMQYRGLLAAQLNNLTHALSGRPPRDPIDAVRAASDTEYSQCASHSIVAGAPANYHPEPCIFEVDTVKVGGPFTDPTSGLGYPNWSFLLPGHTWVPQLLQHVDAWLRAQRSATSSHPDLDASQYDVLVHPNTGCEVRPSGA